jgi:hypothetical protein
MTSTVTLEGVDEPIVLSPMGMVALLEVLAADANQRPPVEIGEVHAATRQRLLGQGLVEEVTAAGVHGAELELTVLGLRVAQAIAEEST